MQVPKHRDLHFLTFLASYQHIGALENMSEAEEQLEIVNEKGEVVGVAPRSAIHGNPALMHRVVHVLVFNASGELLLQRRSMSKDVAPGKWDTSVGGHVGVGEELALSAKREMEEELGITACDLEYLYSYTHTNPYETELVTTYRCVHSGKVFFNRQEIDEVRYWRLEEIARALGSGLLSDNFEHEFRTYAGLQTPRSSGP